MTTRSICREGAPSLSRRKRDELSRDLILLASGRNLTLGTRTRELLGGDQWPLSAS
jgi:hypothetical protein